MKRNRSIADGKAPFKILPAIVVAFVALLLIITTSILPASADDITKSTEKITLSDDSTFVSTQKAILERNGGTATYSESSRTLTLNNIIFVTSASVAIESDYPINMVIEGSCVITSGGAEANETNTIGISSSEISLSGRGTLTVKSGNNFNSTSFGISTGDFNVSGGVELIVYSGAQASAGSSELKSVAIHATTMTVDNSTVRANGGNVNRSSIGMEIDDTLVVSNKSEVISRAGWAISDGSTISIGIRCKQLTISNSNVESYASDSIDNTNSNESQSYGVSSDIIDISDNSNVVAQGSKCSGNTAYSRGITKNNGLFGNLTISSSIVKAIGGAITSKGISCGIEYVSSGVEIKEKSEVTVITEKITGGNTTMGTTGVNTSEILIDDSVLNVATGSVETTYKCDVNVCGISAQSKITIQNKSNIDVECGGIIVLNPYGSYSHSIGINTTGLITIDYSKVSVTIGNVETNTGCDTCGIIANGIFQIINNSEVTVITGDIINVGWNIVAYTRGVSGVSIISDSTVMSHTGEMKVIMDTKENSSTGINFAYGSVVERSIVVAVAEKVSGRSPQSIGILGSPQISDSSIYTRGHTAGFSNEVKISTISGCKTIIGSKSLDEPIFEEIKGTTIPQNYLIVRLVLQSEYHDVTYDLDGGEGSTPEKESVITGLLFTVKSCEASKKGHSFAGWSDGTNTYQPGEVILMGSENISLKAIWKESNSTGGTIVVAIMLILAVIAGFAYYRYKHV